LGRFLSHHQGITNVIPRIRLKFFDEFIACCLRPPIRDPAGALFAVRQRLQRSVGALQIGGSKNNGRFPAVPGRRQTFFAASAMIRFAVRYHNEADHLHRVSYQACPAPAPGPQMTWPSGARFPRNSVGLAPQREYSDGLIITGLPRIAARLHRHNQHRRWFHGEN
jgi:hypothetical protein